MIGGGPERWQLMEQVALVREGPENAVDFFMGPLMKVNARRILPSRLRQLVRDALLSAGSPE